MKKVMLIDTVEPEEVRVAVTADGRLDDFFLERKTRDLAAWNIYRGRVKDIERNLQAAFVDYGEEKHGFLHASDVIPPDGGYRDILDAGSTPAAKSKTHKRRLALQEMLHRGDEILVQVTKDEIGAKGAALTTYLSFPGRYLVLMPGVKRLGVSKRITDEEERRSLRRMLQELSPPKHLGFIVRTAGMGRRKEEFRRDLRYLLRLWEGFKQKACKAKAPALIYQECDLVIRVMRDKLTPDIEEIILDSPEVLERAKAFFESAMSEETRKLTLYSGSEPLFRKYDLEDQIARVFQRKVPLPSGGSIVIEQTEAMVTIDVNSGSTRGKAASVALVSNLEAAEEITRQLRMRDIGGLVMIDFIDMESDKERRQVEESMKAALARDRARTRTTPISEMGVMEMTRQRRGEGPSGFVYEPCRHCAGTGIVKSRESVAIDFFRELRTALRANAAVRFRAVLSPDLALFVANKYRTELAAMESKFGTQIEVLSSSALAPPEFRIETVDVKGKTRPAARVDTSVRKRRTKRGRRKRTLPPAKPKPEEAGKREDARIPSRVETRFAEGLLPPAEEKVLPEPAPPKPAQAAEQVERGLVPSVQEGVEPAASKARAEEASKPAAAPRASRRRASRRRVKARPAGAGAASRRTREAKRGARATSASSADEEKRGPAKRRKTIRSAVSKKTPASGAGKPGRQAASRKTAESDKKSQAGEAKVTKKRRRSRSRRTAKKTGGSD